jgi:hypothetical protein
MREIAKNFLLLEGHLCHPRQRCDDCCKKHLLICEALAEEGAQLDRTGEHAGECEELAEFIRELQKKYIKGYEPCKLAQEIRDKRKKLVVDNFDVIHD